MGDKSWDLSRVQNEIRDAVNGVTRRARCTWSSMDIDLRTPLERDEAQAKSFEYGQLSKQLANPADAALPDDLAARHRARAHGRAGHLAKAAEFDRLAKTLSNPADAQAFARLAARERQEAGIS